jgi:hypothetical protein
VRLFISSFSLSFIYSFLPSASHLFIIVSGDVAYSGELSQYNLATSLLITILEEIKKETSIPVSFIVAPGNHDCNFEHDNFARKSIVKTIEESTTPEIDSSIIDICTSIQSDFFNFRNNLEKNSNPDDDLLWRSSCFNVEGKTLVFDCLNVSWISTLTEKPGRLYFPVDRYIMKDTNDVDIRFVVLHHPLNWFNQSIYRTFRTFVRKLADIIISGHEHQGNVGVINDAETNKSAFIEGCVLQGEKNLSESSFNIVIIDLDQGKFLSIRYTWDDIRYTETEEGSWSDYHDLSTKHNNPFSISEDFQNILDDIGGFFKHPERINITLPDIFIYPNLQRIGSGKNLTRKSINSSTLLSPNMTAMGVLIEGDEKTGCTSLLYQLYRQYHDRGFIPILIKGKNLCKVSDAEVDTLIKRTIEDQYGKSQVTAFMQLSCEQKLLLIDDFDDSPIRAANTRAHLLCSLRKRFKHLVVTVSEIFEVKEMLEGDASSELLSLEHYRIQPFGYVLRSQLIEKWFSLGADGTIDEATIISRCDQAERLVNMVMRRTVIPSIPLYLLILLQSIEAGRSGDFKESALGYYYQYLLTEAFCESGVKPDKLTEIFHYSAHLAWEFNARKKYENHELSEFELRDFNTRFSREWHTVEFDNRLKILLNSRVLYRVGEDYAFRYPYIYYYLKGKYLSEKLHDLDTRAYIRHCCEHVYVRDHANTILFLAHHTNDEYILNIISETIHRLFHSCLPLNFNDDTNGINKLIEDAPKLTYSGEPPSEHRKRRNILKDDLDDGYDGLAESEEDSGDLSRIAQMTALFKTTEILGQILKNQYAKIQRIKKRDLIEQLFNGPLRALRDFYDYFEKPPTLWLPKLRL